MTSANGDRILGHLATVMAQRAADPALLEDGVPSSAVFAAAFGAEQPVASNADAAGRARNRRVEMAPTPRPKPAAATP